MEHLINVKFEFNQLLMMVKQCNQNQKLMIFEELEKETFKQRFKKLMSELKNNDFTAEDITKEVELVRKKRYSKKH